MGIPVYFSYIIKNYPNILQKINDKTNNLFLDSNSIIYDELRNIEYKNDNDFERKLINAVCKKIEDYIQQIKPSSLVYIAFDGVAPIAKLLQQKNRRYKNWYIKEYNKTQDSPKSWDSTSITPGTEFMNKLNLQLKYHFRSPNIHKVKQIIVSGSDEPGEGEHKIFEYIRNSNDIASQTSVIYGLDADLIMLTINHLEYCENMYLYRETPEFIKNIDNSLDANAMYYVNIIEFKKQLQYYLNYDNEPTCKMEENKIYDYIFICFLLGNDFLPHFPALNIRSNGMDILLETYRNVLGNSKKNIITDGKIIWKNLRLLIKELAKNEHSIIIHEYKSKKKLEKRNFVLNEDATKFDKEMLHIPCKDRVVEKYINPEDDCWEARYYDMLFDININDKYRKEISINYLEGLEWTWKYYSTGCIDWRWHYKYHYPPLLTDLLKYIPYFDTDLLEVKDKQPISELTQLAYVLPKTSLHLLPRKLENKLLKEFKDCYKTDFEFVWAFCKYFWECHVDFLLIDIQKLESII